MKNKAIKIASLVDDDKRDIQECVSDLKSNSKLDDNEAIIVAQALRSKYLPKVASQMGLENDFVQELLENNFTIPNLKNLVNSNSNENEAFASNGSNKELVDETSMTDQKTSKTAQNSNNVRTIVADVFSDPELAEFVKIEDNFDLSIEDNDNIIENERIAQKLTESNENDMTNKRGNNMSTKKQSRAALRDKLIREAEQILNSSKEEFRYDGSEQYNVDREYDKMVLDKSDGNSLKKETDAFAGAVGKATVPTMNPAEDMLLRDSYEFFKFDSSPDGGLEYTLPKDMFDLEIPATNVNIGQEFSVPTQQNNLARKTTVAQMDMNEDMDEEMDDDSDEMGVEEFKISLPGSDEEMDEVNDVDDDENEEFESDVTPDDCLTVIDGFSDEDLNAFLSGLNAWADENGVDLTGGGGEEPEESEEARESIASVLGPEFNLEKAEDVLYDNLVKAGIDPEDIKKLTYAQGIELAHKVITSQNTVTLDKDMTKVQLAEDEDITCEDCGMPAEECECEECVGCGKSKSVTSSQTNSELTKAKKEAEVREARIRTAYDIWSRLSSLGVIDSSEISENVDTWIEEGLTVKAMVSQGNIMLKTAQTATRKMKTASADITLTNANALATTPAFTSAGAGGQSAVFDLKSALQGIFMPENE